MNLQDQLQLIEKLHKELEALKQQIKQKNKQIQKAKKDGVKLLKKWSVAFGSVPQEQLTPKLTEEEFKKISPLILSELKNQKAGIGASKLHARLSATTAVEKSVVQAALQKMEESGEIQRGSGRGRPKFKLI